MRKTALLRPKLMPIFRRFCLFELGKATGLFHAFVDRVLLNIPSPLFVRLPMSLPERLGRVSREMPSIALGRPLDMVQPVNMEYNAHVTNVRISLSSVIEMSRVAIAAILFLPLAALAASTDKRATSADAPNNSQAATMAKMAQSTARDKSIHAATVDKTPHVATADKTAHAAAADKTPHVATANKTVHAAPAGKQFPESLPAETLVFPKDRSMGKLYVAVMSLPDREIILKRPHFALAQGVVRVPAATMVRLELSYSGAEDPTPLLKLNSSSLISLDARSIDNFDDKTLQVISQLKNLRELRVDSTDITDHGMELLKTMGTLEDLNVGKTLITGAGIANLKGLTALRRLGIGFNKLNDESMANLEALPVEFLNISAGGLSDNALLHISRMKSLRALDVYDNKKVTNRGMAYLAELPALESLEVHGTSVDMHAFPSFQKMKKLKRLILDSHNFTPQEVAVLRSAMHHSIVEVFAPRGNLSPEMLGPLH